MNEASARLGEYVKRLRTERNLSLRALAARARIGFSYIGKLERGQVDTPDPKYLWKIARALDIEVADIYLEAGYGDAHGLPGLGPYLRAKYHLPADAVRQLEEHFQLIHEKYQTETDATDGEHREGPDA